MASTSTAAAVADETQTSDMDDQPSRPSPRTSPEGRRNGRAVRPRVNPHSAPSPSAQRSKPALDDPDDDSITGESDDNDAAPAPVTPRSPGRYKQQQQPLANPPANQQWQAPPSPHRSRPASFSGPPAEDARRHSGAAPNGGRYRQQQDRPNSGRPQSQGHPPFSPSGPWPKTRAPPPAKPGHVPSRRPYPSVAAAADPRLRAPSPPEPKHHHINRLESPSVAKSVLQPLEKKILEYDRLMHEAQDQMTQLDEELRQLHERRRRTEERFLDAKAKHDDYERQHQDVDRALRGELDELLGGGPPPGPQQHGPPQQQLHPPQMMARQSPVAGDARLESVKSFERRPGSNPVSKHSSRTKKLGTRDRIKLSLFGSL